ncbi:MAG: SCO family protein, partial [Candidatus Anammoxibacter sp.]
APNKLTLINQDNEPVILDSLIGKPLVMSFIFTRCQLPTMCPLIMEKVAKVQKEINKEYKDKVFFVIMTFDPEYDTPEVLKKYGEGYGVDYDNLIYLTGKKSDMDKALTHFRVYAKEEAPGQIAHTMETMVLDEKGVIKRIFPTSIWSPKSVVNEVKKVVANWENR